MCNFLKCIALGIVYDVCFVCMHVYFHIHYLCRSKNKKSIRYTEDLLLLATAKSESIKCITTITVVWSVCSTSTIKGSCGHCYSCNALHLCLRNVAKSCKATVVIYWGNVMYEANSKVRTSMLRA